MLGGHHLDHRRSKPVVLDLAMLNVLSDSCLACVFCGIQNQLFLHFAVVGYTLGCLIWLLLRASICNDYVFIYLFLYNQEVLKSLLYTYLHL